MKPHNRLPLLTKGRDSGTSLTQKTHATNVKAPSSACTLALALALSAAPVWAQQQLFVGGAHTWPWGENLKITGTALTAPITAIIQIPDTDSVWHCVATCSAEVALAVAALDIDGRLVLTADGAAVTGTDRHFELEDNPATNDLSPIVVATTGVILNLNAGEHTIACPAAKVLSGDADFLIKDESITYVCSSYGG